MDNNRYLRVNSLGEVNKLASTHNLVFVDRDYILEKKNWKPEIKKVKRGKTNEK